MKKSLGLILVLFMISACALMKPPTASGYNQTFPKAGWIDGFRSGSSEITKHQLEQIAPVREQMRESYLYRLVLKGSVDQDKIKNGVCNTTQDGLKFFLGESKNSQQNIYGEKECELALGYSRALQVKRVLSESPYHSYGIHASRISVFKEVDFNRRVGDKSLNRAVSYWYVILPDDATEVQFHENPDTGELVVTYQQSPKESFWTKVQKKLKIPPVSEWKVKSWWKEKKEQQPAE